MRDSRHLHSWTVRRDRRRRERDETGDTPEKVAESARRGSETEQQSVEDAAKRASEGLVVSSPSTRF